MHEEVIDPPFHLFYLERGARGTGILLFVPSVSKNGCLVIFDDYLGRRTLDIISIFLDSLDQDSWINDILLDEWIRESVTPKSSYCYCYAERVFLFIFSYMNDGQVLAIFHIKCFYSH